jgi:hypothetical protein
MCNIMDSVDEFHKTVRCFFENINHIEQDELNSLLFLKFQPF